jgi:hypothetical protein
MSVAIGRLWALPFPRTGCVNLASIVCQSPAILRNALSGAVAPSPNM